MELVQNREIFSTLFTHIAPWSNSVNGSALICLNGKIPPGKCTNCLRLHKNGNFGNNFFLELNSCKRCTVLTADVLLRLAALRVAKKQKLTKFRHRQVTAKAASTGPSLMSTVPRNGSVDVSTSNFQAKLRSYLRSWGGRNLHMRISTCFQHQLPT